MSAPTAPTPPAVPDAPTAVAGINSATVTWTAPASNGSPITGYTVIPSSGSPVAIGNVLTRTFTGLASTIPLTFRVVATNLVGNSLASTVSNSVTPTAPTTGPPSAVLGVTGVARPASALISWNPPISDGGLPITGYKIICVPDNKGGAKNLVGPTARSHLVEGIKNTVSTLYTVVALNAAGQSNSLTLTPHALPGVPKVTAVRGVSGTINMRWTASPSNVASPITGYVVSVVSTLPTPQTMVIPTPTVTATGGLVSVSGLTNGTSYVFSVQSVSNIGPSLGGLSKAVIAAGLPDAPTNFAGSRAVKSAGLTWVAPQNTGGLPITGYEISYTMAGVAKILAVKVVTTAIIKSLVDNTPYTFTIKTLTLIGKSVASQSVTVTPGTGL